MSIFNSDIKLEEITSLLKKIKGTVYFVGILGSGMYPLARFLAGRGYSVCGSDDNAKEDSYTDAFGIRIHRSREALECELAVYSLAIDEANPEIAYAVANGIPLISRAQLLGAVMRDYRTRISVSGSHGKSTTTALIDHILAVADRPHTTVSGASLTGGESLFDGGGDIFLAEACEYKDSFLRLCPSHQLITSVELDHTDYFKSIDMLYSSFLKAARSADVTLVNADDSRAFEIAESLKGTDDTRRVYTYGRDKRADYRLGAVERKGEITSFEIAFGKQTFRLSTHLIGEFNLYNISAAVAMAHIIGIDRADIERAVASFVTIDRRLSLISRINNIPIYYDYAHHPTEIGRAITALKERYGTLTVIFRPHTYSRTQSLWNDFIAEFSKSDFTILLDIYPAREKYIQGVDSEKLASQIPRCVYSSGGDAVKTALSYHTGAIALMGAGDVEDIKGELIRLGKNTGELPERR